MKRFGSISEAMEHRSNEGVELTCEDCDKTLVRARPTPNTRCTSCGGHCVAEQKEEPIEEGKEEPIEEAKIEGSLIRGGRKDNMRINKVTVKKNGLFFDISHLIGTSNEDSFEADVSLKQMAKYAK